MILRFGTTIFLKLQIQIGKGKSSFLISLTQEEEALPPYVDICDFDVISHTIPNKGRTQVLELDIDGKIISVINICVMCRRSVKLSFRT